MKDIDIYDREFAGKYTTERDKFLNADKYIFQALEDIDLGDKVVVDVGCGNGRHARKIYEMGAAKVIGVDSSPSMIALASENASEDVTFAVAEASDTGQGSGAADVVFSSFVIHYVKDLNPVFSEFNRILKKGGTIVMTFNVFETDDDSLHNTGVQLRLADVVVVTNLVKSHDEVKDTLKSNGFTINSYDEIDSSYLSIDDTFEYKDKITAIKNILCVATKT
jgi:ubiquinone/menaquinone biosynthesis C-methylase UbiE